MILCVIAVIFLCRIGWHIFTTTLFENPVHGEAKLPVAHGKDIASGLHLASRSVMQLALHRNHL